MLTAEAFTKAINDDPCIFAVTSDSSYYTALASDISIVFLLHSSILDLDEKVGSLLKRGKIVFVHVDMIQGLDSSPTALEYLAGRFGGNVGVITTKNQLVRKANSLDMRVILRAFIVDSMSKDSLIANLGSKIRPDAVEIMPASSVKIVRDIKLHHPGSMIIAGGLIKDKAESEAILKSGADAISSSNIKILL